MKPTEHLIRCGFGVRTIIPAAIVLLLVSLHLASPKRVYAEDITKHVTTGDPYDLNGNRIVFTNCYYVRPGIYTWQDAAGKNVTTNRNPARNSWKPIFRAECGGELIILRFRMIMRAFFTRF